jgi:hypothetical protein
MRQRATCARTFIDPQSVRRRGRPQGRDQDRGSEQSEPLSTLQLRATLTKPRLFRLTAIMCRPGG